MKGGLYDFKICFIGNADNKPSVSISLFLMPCVCHLWDAPEEAVRARVNYYTLVCQSLPSVYHYPLLNSASFLSSPVLEYISFHLFFKVEKTHSVPFYSIPFRSR